MGKIIEDIIMSDYSKSDDSVYYNGDVIKNANFETFELMWNNFYAKDKNHVFYMGSILEWVSPSTFTLLSNGYGKSESSIYKGNRKLKEADLKTFAIISIWFCKDKHRVFYRAEPVEDWIDASSFEFVPRNLWSSNADDSMNDLYMRDRNRVYTTFSGVEVLEWADPETIEYLWDYFSKDKNRVYLYQNPLFHLDIPTFEILSYFCFKDKNGVYLCSDENIIHKFIPPMKIEQADPETFKLYPENFYYGSDKNRVYWIKKYKRCLDENNEISPGYIIIDIHPDKFEPPSDF